MYTCVYLCILVYTCVYLCIFVYICEYLCVLPFHTLIGLHQPLAQRPGATCQESQSLVNQGLGPNPSFPSQASYIPLLSLPPCQ